MFRVLHASAAVDHLQERPLRVALGAEHTIDLLDLDRDVDARLDHRTVEEDVGVLQGLVDVLERLSLGLAAVRPDEPLDVQVGIALLELGLQHNDSDSHPTPAPRPALRAADPQGIHRRITVRPQPHAHIRQTHS